MSFEFLEAGTEAPICLTWELTYACNLACTHCLSSSGKRRSDELTLGEIQALVDEWAASGVFYVNIGGGEPMVRPDFFEIIELHRGLPHRRQLLHQRDPDRCGPSTTAGGHGLRRPAGQPRRRRRRRPTTPSAGPAATPGRVGPWTTSPMPASRTSRSASCSRAAVHHPARPSAGAGRRLRCAAAPDAPAALGSGRRRLGRAAPDAPPSSVTCTPGCSTIPRCSPATRSSTSMPSAVPAGPLDVRRRAHRLPRRPGGRCLRLPVPHPSRLQGRQHPQRRRFSQIWQTASLFAEMRTPTVAAEGGCVSCTAFEVCKGGCIAAKLAAGTSMAGPDPECVHDAAPSAPRFRGRPLPVIAGL